MSLKVTVLGSGTSSGVPRIGNDWGACDPNEPKNRRTRPSILVETASTRLLIDTSPDMREQLLAADVIDIDAVLWTHDHADHSHGLDDVRQLRRARRSLARAIRSARPGAVQGEFFTPAISAQVRLALAPLMDDAMCAVIMDDNPGGFTHAIDGAYPDGKAFATMPGLLLARLPELPADIQFRFIGRHLILYDVRANTIVDRMREVAAAWSPDRVAAVTGIAADRIRALAREMASTERAVVYGRIGLCNQEFGSLASWLVDVVNILAGHFDSPGGSMFPRAAAWSVTVRSVPARMRRDATERVPRAGRCRFLEAVAATLRHGRGRPLLP